MGSLPRAEIGTRTDWSCRRGSESASFPQFHFEGTELFYVMIPNYQLQLKKKMEIKLIVRNQIHKEKVFLVFH